MTRARKRVLLCALLLVMVGLVLCGGWLWHSRGSAPVTVSPTVNAMPDSAVHFYQKDAAWKNDTLGDSAYTMADSGCLTCCLAAAFLMQHVPPEGFSDELTPGTLNAYFSANSIYDSEGNLQWDVLSQTAGIDIVMKDADDLTDGELEQLLSDGIFPIVKVRVGGVGSYHFVLLTGSENGSFLCMDPLKQEDKMVPLSDFGGKIYAVRYITDKNS